MIKMSRKPLLKAYTVGEVDFKNKLKPNTKIELGNKISYNVSYAKNNIARGEITVETSPRNNTGEFFMKVVMIGVFEYDPATPKETLHVETYDALFPFLKAFVATLTSATGIPPVMLPVVDISNQNIYTIRKPPMPPQNDDGIVTYDE